MHCTWVQLYAYTTTIFATAYSPDITGDACTAFDIGMYNAIIQESTIVYMQGYTSKMPTKICC